MNGWIIASVLAVLVIVTGYILWSRFRKVDPRPTRARSAVPAPTIDAEELRRRAAASGTTAPSAPAAGQAAGRSVRPSSTRRTELDVDDIVTTYPSSSGYVSPSTSESYGSDSGASERSSGYSYGGGSDSGSSYGGGSSYSGGSDSGSSGSSSGGGGGGGE